MQTTYAEATNFNWHSLSENLGEGYNQNLTSQLSTSLASDFQSPTLQSSALGYNDPNLIYTSTTSNLGYGSSYDPIIANTQYQSQFDRKVSDFASQGSSQDSGLKDESKEKSKDLSKEKSKDLSKEKSKDASKDWQKDSSKSQSVQQQTTTQQQTFTQQQAFAQPQTFTDSSLSYVNAPLMSRYALPTSTFSTNYSAMPAGASYWAYPVLFPGTSTMFEDKIIEIYYPPRQRRGLFGRRGKKAAAPNAYYAYPMAPGGFQTLAPPLGATNPYLGTMNAPLTTLNAPLTTVTQPLTMNAPLTTWNAPLTTVTQPLTSMSPISTLNNPIAEMNPMSQLNPFTRAANIPVQSASSIRAM